MSATHRNMELDRLRAIAAQLCARAVKTGGCDTKSLMEVVPARLEGTARVTGRI